MPHITIIRVQSGQDFYKCLQIRKKVFTEEQNVPAHIEIDEYDRSFESCCHLLCEADGYPAGTGRWRPYDEVTAKLQRVAVLPEYRGMGIGRSIILELENEAAKAGMRIAVLDGQCHAEEFYKRLGYDTVSEPFEEAGIMHVRMSKRLHAPN